MSPESQRTALAEACGLFSRSAGFSDQDVFKNRIHLHFPAYLSDLNAINQAEQHLITESNYFDFLNNLHTVMGRPQNGAWPIRATAAQRAEALLNTCGLWEGGVA